MKLTSKETQVLAGHVSNAVPTGAKLASWGYAVTSKYTMCDEDHEDTQYDRVFVCKVSEG